MLSRVLGRVLGRELGVEGRVLGVFLGRLRKLLKSEFDGRDGLVEGRVTPPVEGRVEGLEGVDGRVEGLDGVEGRVDGRRDGVDGRL